MGLSPNFEGGQVVRVDALGVLKGISWKSYPAGNLEKIRTGYDLIPKQLRFRLLNKEEKEKISLHPLLSDTALRGGVERYFVLESKNTTTNSLLEANHPIKKALLAFQLLKPGGVFLEGICLFDTITGKVRGKLYTLPIPIAYTAYEFNLYEIENLVNMINRLQTVDLEKNSSLRIASDRFSSSYNEIPPEDKLIDLCIGMEALFFKDIKDKGDRRVTRKGMIIGLACSMLLGKNDKERHEILKNVKEAFQKRNDVVHGEVTDFGEMYRLSAYLEDYLRRSILRLIP